MGAPQSWRRLGHTPQQNSEMPSTSVPCCAFSLGTSAGTTAGAGDGAGGLGCGGAGPGVGGGEGCGGGGGGLGGALAQLLSATHLAMVLKLPLPFVNVRHLPSGGLLQLYVGGGGAGGGGFGGAGGGGGGGFGFAQLLSATHATILLNFPLPSVNVLHFPSGGLSQLYVGGDGAASSVNVYDVVTLS